ncbi:MAG: UDP-N-acetylglucosamine 2-epimerase (non-hydrolyzing), partial [Candidatus Nanohalarchaeota archaeon]
MKKIITIIGVRPQFIKSAQVSMGIRKYFNEVIVHTGQHYDKNMSKIFFEELDIPKPDYNLCIGSGNHGEQTGKMMTEIEKILIKENPEFVIVYGDTNSTLAGALVASKLHVKIVHIEAGLRSFDKRMPEEINRVCTDHISDVLFCPTGISVVNLKNEGITQQVYKVGDVMYDAAILNSKIAEKKSNILENLEIKPRDYLLATIHRPSNTDSYRNMLSIIDAFIKSGEKIIFSLHPRTKKYLTDYNLSDRIKKSRNIITIDPIGYLDMLVLEKNAKKILTDSGGVQKEAYFFSVPCITLRETTEWVETVNHGWNLLVGTDKTKIVEAI